jgi:undecaprenyl diphosphate synthase
MHIFFNNTLDEETNTFLRDNRINYRWIGSPIGISEELVESLYNKMSEHYYPKSERTMCVAINYGGRNEIIRAIHEYSAQGHSIDDLSEEKLEHYLDTHDLPVPDLIIRTKSHRAQRLSGFMSWQAAYAELYFTETLFPDFDESELQKALDRFNKIATHRNFGQ